MRKDTLGRRIRRLRIARGLTQADLAQPRYTPPYVSIIESGRRRPSPAALEYFAAKLGVTIDELESGRPPGLEARLELHLQETYDRLYSGAYDEAAEAFGTLSREARAARLPTIEARAEEGRGIVAERRGDPATALTHFESALELWQGHPLPHHVEAIAGIARCSQMRGDIRYAIHVLESYLMVLEKEKLWEPVAVVRAQSSLIWPYSEAGLFDKAQQAAAAALELAPRIEAPEQVANMHMNVARELLRLGHPDEALMSLARAEDCYRALNWRAELARAHGNKAIVFAQEGRLAEARAENLRALEMIGGSAGRLSEARALNELARVDRLLGDVDAAEASVARALSLLAESDVGERARAHFELGLCRVDRDPRSAEEHLREAIKLYRETESFLRVAEVYRELGDLLCKQGRNEHGLTAYREGLVAVTAA